MINCCAWRAVRRLPLPCECCFNHYHVYMNVHHRCIHCIMIECLCCCQHKHIEQIMSRKPTLTCRKHIWFSVARAWLCIRIKEGPYAIIVTLTGHRSSCSKLPTVSPATPFVRLRVSPCFCHSTTCFSVRLAVVVIVPILFLLDKGPSHASSMHSQCHGKNST